MTATRSILELKIGAGAWQTGGIVGSVGDWVTLRSQTSDAGTYRFEIYGSPPDWTGPPHAVGQWVWDASSLSWYYLGSNPPSFQMDLWGKYMPRLILDNGMRAGVIDLNLTDDSTAVEARPVSNLRDIGRLEENQFGEGWQVALQRDLRILEAMGTTGFTGGSANEVLGNAGAGPVWTGSPQVNSLTALSWLAVGAMPATAGALRMSSGDYVKSYAGTAGDYNLVGFSGTTVAVGTAATSTTIYGTHVTIASAASVAGPLTVTGALSANSGLAVTGSVAVSGNVVATGNVVAAMVSATTLYASTAVQSNAYVAANTYVSAQTYLAAGTGTEPTVGGVRLSAAASSVYCRDSGAANMALVSCSSDIATLGDTAHQSMILAPGVLLRTETDHITALASNQVVGVTPDLLLAETSTYSQHLLFEFHKTTSSTAAFNCDMDVDAFMYGCLAFDCKWRILKYNSVTATACGGCETSAGYSNLSSTLAVTQLGVGGTAEQRMTSMPTLVPDASGTNIRLTLTPPSSSACKWVILLDALGCY